MKAELAASLLARTDLFGGLDQETLGALAERSRTRIVRKGQFVFHEGDPGDALFVVAEGVVKLVVTSDEGDEMVLAAVRPPEILGELAVVDGGPRAASAQALRPARLLAISRPDFREVLRARPVVAEALLRLLGDRLRRSTEYAAGLVFLDLTGRVAKLLLDMAEDHGERREDAIVLDLDVTQGDLAAMVGGSRPSVNQILRSFEGRGYLEIEGRTIRIRRPEGLRRRSGV